IAKAGYTATLITNSRTVSASQKTNTLPVIASGALIALGFTGSFFGLPALMSNVLYAIAMIISGYKPAKSAYYGIKSRSLDMNVLM
ncbi:hypothetical protein KZ294_26960, partial [Escherichia coli]|nr:hypothetical protein [Escherichia coli]